MSDIPWGLLLERIKSERLTPFLGAGISRPPLPSGRELAEELASNYEFPFLSRDLMEVAQYAATTIDGAAPKAVVREIFEKIPDPDFADPAQPHAILASLPIPVYLTTNYDDYMEKALREKFRTPVTEICRWNKGLKERLPSHLLDNVPEIGKPVVFHLHGHVTDDDSFVLTEDDYLDFIVNARRFEGVMSPSAYVLPRKVSELISSTSLLFLGYGLRDWNLRVLLRALVQSADVSDQKISVSVQVEPEDSLLEDDGREKAIEYLEKYFDGLKIRVYWGTARAFLAELKTRWDDLDATASPVVTGTP